MRLPEHKDLWNRISEFPLDDAYAENKFSDRLAAEQDWSRGYTENVIEEYLKFIFLCCISPKGASPSKAVDEAWHLHLTYTKSYWTDLCKNTLGREIHHHPSKGGRAETHKHTDWYNETLALYKSVFGYEAPTDIWPRPGHSRISEPTVKVPVIRFAISMGIFLLPFLFIYVVYAVISPYDLTGPQFLLFYPAFVVAMLVAYYLYERGNREYFYQLVEENFQKGTTIFQKVKFLMGKNRALQLAIVDLVRRDLLKLQPDKNFIVQKHNYKKEDREENPLMQEFFRAEEGSAIKYDQIDASWYNDAAFSHPSLQMLHQFAYRRKNFWQKYLLIIIVFGFGLARLIQGLADRQPVLMLIIEMFLLHLLVYYSRKLFYRNVTIFSDAEIRFREHAEKSQLHHEEVVSGFALDGPSALSGIPEGALLMTIFLAHGRVKQGSVFSSNNSEGSCGGTGRTGCSSDGGGGCSGCSGDGD